MTQVRVSSPPLFAAASDTPSATSHCSLRPSWPVDGERSYEAGKKVTGCKRHPAVDTLGLILAAVVHHADLQDQDGARQLLDQVHPGFDRLKVIFADATYAHSGLPDWVQVIFGWILQTVLRPAGVQGIVVLPKRWIVEHTFACLGRCSRNSKDYERTSEPSAAMIQITMINLMPRPLARLKR